MSDPIFCVPVMNRSDLITELQLDLDRLETFDPRLNYMTAAESAASASVAVKARIRALLQVYKGEYHTDSFDLARVGKRVSEGRELIWFWGVTDQIAILRDAFRKGTLNDGQILFGTVTLISAEDEFGLGYGESCRSGSIATGTGAKAAFMTRLLDFMTGESSVLHDRYHSMVSATRNCSKRSSAEGGEAIHQIGKRYVRSRFWGYLPWYVMPGGVLELLELREANRDPDDVLRAFNSEGTWYFADQREAAYAQALAAINFDVSVKVHVDSNEYVDQSALFRLTMPATESLMKYNHGSLTLGEQSEQGIELHAGLERLKSLGVSCVAVHLTLTDPQSVGVQRRLLRQGFMLGAVVPPKKTWIRGIDGSSKKITTNAVGIWNLPRKDLPLVPPYYLDRAPKNDMEKEILEYTRECLLARDIY